MSENMKIDVPALRSLHRFGDIYEQAILAADSDLVRFAPERSAKDCIGPHWYGLRVHMECKKTGQHFYLHTGLIFLPETRTGLMVELDKANNQIPYEMVWNNIEGGDLFEVNRDEPVYLKLFMPDAGFARMNSLDSGGQRQMLRDYITACGEAICKAACMEGFALDYGALANTLRLARCFKAVLEEAGSEEYSVQVNAADPDNFGQYASGYRYWLEDKKSGNRMYAYFGGIYSYKKEPAGIFAEIDWLNNQAVFDAAFANMKPTGLFTFSAAEPKFIKLFMAPETVEAFNAAEAAKQKEIMASFLHAANTALVQAAR